MNRAMPPANLTDEELRELERLARLYQERGTSSIPVTTDELLQLLASARAVRNVEHIVSNARASIDSGVELAPSDVLVPMLVAALEAALATTEPTAGEDEAPYVCPGCHAVAEPCAPGCVDAAIEERREREREECEYETE